MLADSTEVGTTGCPIAHILAGPFRRPTTRLWELDRLGRADSSGSRLAAQPLLVVASFATLQKAWVFIALLSTAKQHMNVGASPENDDCNLMLFA